MENIIEINNLTYKSIFNKFSLNIKSNKFISVSGPNKCGKTTLLRMLSGKILTTNHIIINNNEQIHYSQNELSNIIQLISEEDMSFNLDQVETELQYYYNVNNKITLDKYKEIVKGLKLSKLSIENPNYIDDSNKIKIQIAKALFKNIKILLLDDIDTLMNKKEMIELISFLKDYQKKNSITIVIVTNNLEYTLYTDELIIFEDSKIVLEGNPKEVLQKDNIINKSGLALPFMMDLSVKLRDYDLIKNIELDPERMIESLWK